MQEPRTQVALLGGLLAAIVLVIVLTDVATGGDTETPPALGSAIEATPGSRVLVVPTLAPITTPTPVVAAATATASSAAEALARDTERLGELAVIQSALAEYRERFKKYPDTEGNLQTLCNYKDLDKGCDLRKVLEDDEEGFLEDPLGSPLDNGYWYASDGDTYTIWALREGPGNPGDPICPDAPVHLKEKGNLFCVSGGGSR